MDGGIRPPRVQTTTTSEDHEALTEETPQPARRRDLRSDRPGDTQTQHRPQGPTRRELRLAEQAHVAAQAPRPAQARPAEARPAEAPAGTDRSDAVHPRLLAPAPPVDAAPSDGRAPRPTLAAAVSTPSTDAPTPRTRRELRLAAEAACRPVFPLVELSPAQPGPGVPVAKRDAAVATAPGTVLRGAGDTAPSATRAPHRAGKSAVVVALSAALVASGLSLHESDQARAADQVAAAGAQAARLHDVRVQGAATARLTAQANAYAVARKREAVAIAQTAMAQADAVTRTAAPVVDPTALSPLDTAVAELERLVTAEGAVPTTEIAERAMTRTSRSTAVRPPVSEAAAAAATQTAADAASRTPADAAGPTPSPSETSEAATTPDAADRSEGRGTAREVNEHLAAADELEAAAAKVVALSSQVQATADAKIAEAAQRAAEEAAAAELARKVAVAKAAPNGAIPVDVLCSPDFAADALMRCDAAEALEDLNLAYRAAFGHDLDVVSSYRSYGMQVSTRRSRGWLAAQPGTSNHGLAVAVDFANFGRVGSFGNASYRWMKEHSQQFGWHHPRIMEPGGGGPQEPWHWEFGTEDAVG